MNRKNIIIGSIALALLGGGYTVQQNLGGKDAIKLENPEHIVWEKPSTDAQWAEDVKAESFHIKSTGRLEEMRDAHAKKLPIVEAENARILECPECIKYDLKVSNPEWTQVDIENEYKNMVDTATFEVEKLKQSIERMDNEIRLREKGFVVVEDESKNLGGVSPDRIRYIND